MEKCNFCNNEEALEQVSFEDEKGKCLPVCFKCAEKIIHQSFQPEINIEVPSGIYEKE